MREMYNLGFNNLTNVKDELKTFVVNESSKSSIPAKPPVVINLSPSNNGKNVTASAPLPNDDWSFIFVDVDLGNGVGTPFNIARGQSQVSYQLSNFYAQTSSHYWWQMARLIITVTDDMITAEITDFRQWDQDKGTLSTSWGSNTNLPATWSITTFKILRGYL